MNKLKKILIIIVLLSLLSGGAAGAWFIYENFHFYKTENAQITADMITITPEITGKLKNWDIHEGDMVTAGQVLGRQEVDMLVTNTAMNIQNLSDSADSILAKTEIKSPINGKVIRSDVIKGQVIAPGMEISVIANTAYFYVKANIEETDIFRIKPGQKVDILIDAYPGRHFNGLVESIGQATESAFNTFPSLNTSGEFSKVTQLIPVKINIVNAGDLVFMPGINATVKIHIQ